MNNNCTRNSIKKCLYNDENDNTMFIHKKNRYDVFSSLINNVCFFIKISSNIYFSDFINYIVDIFIDKYKDKDVTISKQDVQDFTNTYYGIKNILNNISQQLGIKYGLEELFTNVINILSVSKCDIKEFINEHNNESSNNKKYHLLNSFLLYLFTDFYTDLKTIYANTETLLKDYCVKNTVIFRFSKMAQNINKFQKDIQAYKLAKKKEANQLKE